MKLKSLSLKNFRCYEELNDFKVNNLNCIIGKNDIGKSTILEALDAFFNDNIDVDDLCQYNDENEIQIKCVFGNVPEKMILDSSVETNLFEEGILNINRNLEVIKKYKLGSRGFSKSIYLNAYNYSHEISKDLLKHKNTKLKNLADEYGIDYKGIATKNPLLRQKVRENFPKERKEELIKVDGGIDKESNIKKIWPNINKKLPVFSLFKVDKELNDKDGDVKDPLKSAIEETLLIEEIDKKLQDVQDMIKQRSTEVADRIIQNLKEIDEEIAENLKSDFRKEPSWKSIFDLTLLNDKNVPLNKRGSGVRRLVLLSFFQAQAQKRKEEKNAPSIIYAIEEPETSQHPNHQIILINSLIELSKTNNTQVFFTTHSANLVKKIPIKSLRYLSKEAESVVIQNAFDFKERKRNELVLDSIIETLGILPDPRNTAKILVFVEGKNDVSALKIYYEILVEKKLINDFGLNNVAWVVAGGQTLVDYLNFGYLKNLGKPEFHLYDNDKEQYRKVVQDINEENSTFKRAFNTKKLELENYLHNQAINEYYQSQGNTCNLEIIKDNDDVPFIVAEELYNSDSKNWEDLEPHEKKKKANAKKKVLNNEIISFMTAEFLVERDAIEEMQLWFNTIEEIIDKN